MFVRYYVDLKLPFEVVEAILLDDPAGWIPGIAEKAESGGDSLLAEVGFGRGRARIDKEVEVTLGPPRRLDRATLLPMSWTPRSPKRLFPKLDADIELSALGADRTHLALSARYRPPLGGIGRTLDRASLHAVAEATIKDFLENVADHLRARVGDNAASRMTP
jgi:hypothetical protein